MACDLLPKVGLIQEDSLLGFLTVGALLESPELISTQVITGMSGESLASDIGKSRDTATLGTKNVIHDNNGYLYKRVIHI